VKSGQTKWRQPHNLEIVDCNNAADSVSECQNTRPSVLVQISIIASSV